MPTQNGLRLDDGDRATPRRQQARAYQQLQPIYEMGASGACCVEER
jgi:hypothetical protein